MTKEKRFFSAYQIMCWAEPLYSVYGYPTAEAFLKDHPEFQKESKKASIEINFDPNIHKKKDD